MCMYKYISYNGSKGFYLDILGSAVNTETSKMKIPALGVMIARIIGHRAFIGILYIDFFSQTRTQTMQCSSPCI